jgi:tetratricopeptide (TPR) repeat protein
LNKGFAVLFSVFLALLFFQNAAYSESNITELDLAGIGKIKLSITEFSGIGNSQLIVIKPGGLKKVIDSFEGLRPFQLRKFDLDGDNRVEIIALLKHPDGTELLPFIYFTDADFTRVHPSADTKDIAPLVFREIVLTMSGKTPVLCGKRVVNFHDYGPPELFRLEFYRLKSSGLELFDKGFNEGTHYNILLNRGAYAFNQGDYIDAIDFYDQAISLSTGDIPVDAFVEGLFFLAESHKFTKNFKKALELYEKIVLEFRQNQLVEQSQREIELIAPNLDNVAELSYYIDILVLFNTRRLNEALNLLENSRFDSGRLLDRFQFMKAEIFSAQNRIEEALKIYADFSDQFPDSSLLEEVKSLYRDMQEVPEENGGL